MNQKSILAVACLALALAPALSAQMAVPPPPRPVDAGPSLVDTFNFIQQKLAGLGKVNIANYVHDNAAGNDWIVTNGYEISDITTNPASCLISFKFTESKDGQVTQSVSGGVPFRNVEDVVIVPIEQVWKEVDSRGGNTTRTYRSDPPLSVLKVRRRNNGGENDFFFTDQTLADRVAKAMVHAIELCGGGNKDPF